MTATRPWAKLDAAARVEAVRPLEDAGDANGIIAFRLKAPRKDVDRICALLRRERHAAEDQESAQHGSAVLLGAAGSASDTIPAFQSQAKASEDNGATGPAITDSGPADCMTGEASRPASGRSDAATSDDGRDGSERRAPNAPEVATELLGGLPVAAAESNAEETGRTPAYATRGRSGTPSGAGVTAGETAPNSPHFEADENGGAVRGVVFAAGTAEKPYCAASPLSGGPVNSDGGAIAAVMGKARLADAAGVEPLPSDPDPAAPSRQVTAPGRATSSPPARDSFPPWRDMSARKRDEAVMALRADGLTIDEVGDRLGVSRSAISGLIFRLKQRGVAVPGNTDRTRKAEEKAFRRSPRSKDEPPTRWQTLNARAKEAEIVRMAAAGMTVAAMMAEMGASEHAVRFVIGRLRKAGETVVARPAPKPRPTTLRKTPNGIEARPLRGPNNPHPNDFKARAAKRAEAPGIVITSASAFDPIPGLEPVPFSSPGCKWPVDGRDGPGMLACGAPKDITGSYCQAHAHLAYRPALYRLRAPRGA